MIAFATIILIIGALLLAISSPRKQGEFRLGAKDMQINLPEITGPMRIPMFIFGLALIGIGLWMGVLLFQEFLEADDETVRENSRSNITPESVTGDVQESGNQDTVSALETQIALQETAIVQQEKLISEAHTPTPHQPMDDSSEISSTSSPISPATSTPFPTSQPTTSERSPCITSQHTSIGNDLVGRADDPIVQGGSKIYSHCPPAESIRYIEVSGDDYISKVELICQDSTTDITNLFSQFDKLGELFPYYESQSIQVPDGCLINFTVTDKNGVNVGIIFRATIP